ncbi:MAG: hypothetical protein ACOYJ2_01860 [Rickettsiales bacterium]
MAVGDQGGTTRRVTQGNNGTLTAAGSYVEEDKLSGQNIVRPNATIWRATNGALSNLSSYLGLQTGSMPLGSGLRGRLGEAIYDRLDRLDGAGATDYAPLVTSVVENIRTSPEFVRLNTAKAEHQRATQEASAIQARLGRQSLRELTDSLSLVAVNNALGDSVNGYELSTETVLVRSLSTKAVSLKVNKGIGYQGSLDEYLTARSAPNASPAIKQYKEHCAF